MTTLRYTTNINEVATDVTSVVLCDPAGTYGVKRNDTGGTVVVANTSLDNLSPGVYSYTFDTIGGIQYTAWIKRTYGRKVSYREVVWTPVVAEEEVVAAEVTAADTLELISQYGTEAIFYTDTPSFDPATSLTTRAAVATHIVMVLEESRKYAIPNNADVVLYFSPSGLSFTPAIEQKISYKGQHWRAVSVEPTTYQGVTLLWTAMLKGVS
jgi:hypothetical protein